jgi:hypothetical protein
MAVDAARPRSMEVERSPIVVFTTVRSGRLTDWRPNAIMGVQVLVV